MMNILDEAVQLTDEDGRTFEKVDSSLKYYFDKFNQAYFNGVLAPIKLTWMKGSKLHGYFAYRPIIKEKRFNPICIKLNLNACGTYAAFRNVFVHEMLHYYVHCYTKLPDECWEIAERRANNRDKAGVDKILRNSKDTCHGFEWGRIAIELSAKHPELGNIERYAVKNIETGVALMDADYVAEWAMKNVMLKQEYKGNTYYYIVSVNCPDWKKLQEALSSGKSGQNRFCGKWTRMFSTLDPNNFVQMRVQRDMSNYYTRIKPEMVRRERELGRVEFDTENASKSGMSQEAINNWCDNVTVYCKNKAKVYFVKRGSKAYFALKQALRTGSSTDYDLQGSWEIFEINRDPKYFVAFATTMKSFNGYYDIDRITSKFNYILDRHYVGDVKWHVEEW